jgi:uncharacterized protein (DUF4415 family)
MAKKSKRVPVIRDGKRTYKVQREDRLGDWQFDPSKAKVLISIRLDGEVLEAVKSAAASRGMKYQTLINELLKRELLGSPNEKLDLKRAISELEARMSALEGIGKKAG